jgi:hypothetical protein
VEILIDREKKAATKAAAAAKDLDNQLNESVGILNNARQQQQQSLQLSL